MKKKIFSASLLFALTLAATSTFVSCKDYDDDINSLRDDINSLKTADELFAKTEDMKAAIEAAKKDLDGQISSIETIAKAAQTSADAANKAVEDLKKSGEATQKQIEAAQAAADAANASADEAKKALDAYRASNDKAVADALAAAKEAAAQAKTANDALAGLTGENGSVAKAQAAADAAAKAAQDAQATATAAQNAAKEANDAIAALKGEKYVEGTTLAGLSARISTVEAILGVGQATGKPVDLQALNTKVDSIAGALKAIVGEYTTMVTSVDFFAKTYEDADTVPKLNFVYVAGEQDNKFPLDANIADKQFIFSKDKKSLSYETSDVVLRVSPTNADLTKIDPANITLINSQGKTLDMVEVSKVARYNDLVYGSTRAAATTDGNGLWTVTFKMKDGVDPADFLAATTTKVNGVDHYVSFAAAIHNTASDETRRVISGYSAEVKADAATQLAYENFTVKDSEGKLYGMYKDTQKGIELAQNRFGKNNGGNDYRWVGQNPADKTAESGTWDAAKYPTPATALALDGNGKALNAKNATGTPSATQPWNDNRTSGKLVPVLLNKDIEINFVDAGPSKIKGFYVTLDRKFAETASAPSELNAWDSYTYTGVSTNNQKATLIEGTKGSIQVNKVPYKELADGEVIGFRVYAVNYDGTLVDPDGRAFYVKVGTADTEADVNLNAVTVVADKQNKTTDAISLNDALSIDWDKNAPALTWTIEKVVDANGNDITATGRENFIATYYEKANSQTTATDLDKYNFVKFSFADATKVIDGATYTLIARLAKTTDGYAQVVRNIRVNITKVLPTEAPALVLAQGMDAKYNWLTPKDNYKVGTSDDPTITDFKTVYTNLENGNNYYTLTIADADKTADYTVLNPTTGYKYNIKSKVLNDYAKIATDYVYKNVSSSDKGADVKIAGETIPEFGFLTWTKAYDLVWADKYENKLTYAVEGSLDATKLLTEKVVESAPSAFNAKSFEFLAYSKYFNTPVAVTLSEKADANVASKYFDVKYETKTSDPTKKYEGYFTFTPKQGVGVGTTITQYLRITVKDCFGISKTFTAPVVINQ